MTNLLTSSADWAMKKPCVLGSILMLGPGLMAMQLSTLSSPRASIAINNNFNRRKHILKGKQSNYFQAFHKLLNIKLKTSFFLFNKQLFLGFCTI